MPPFLTAAGPPIEDPEPPLAPRAEANWLHHLGGICYMDARRAIAARSGEPETSWNVSSLAVRYTAELFADLAHFSKQGVCLFRCQQLIIHPVHAAIWLHVRLFGAALQAEQARGGPSLGEALWSSVPALCGFLKSGLGGDAVTADVTRGLSAPVKVVRVGGVDGVDLAHTRLLRAQKYIQ